MFRTAFNGKTKISGEDYSKVVSITEPEQVLPLKRILSGLKNGSIILDSKPQHFDVPEHEIDFVQGRTPESTNAAIHEAQLNDLAASADAAGTDITAAPGFTPEDAHGLMDAVEAAVSSSTIKTGATVSANDSGADAQQKGDTGDVAADAGKSSTSGEGAAA